MILSEWQLDQVEGRYARQRWWQRHGIQLVDPTNSPVDVNLYSEEDPWPGTLTQFRSLFRYKATKAGLLCTVHTVDVATIRVTTKEPEPLSLRPLPSQQQTARGSSDWSSEKTPPQIIAEARKKPLLKMRVPVPKTLADFPCDCGSTQRRHHEPGCNVWRLFTSATPDPGRVLAYDDDLEP